MHSEKFTLQSGKLIELTMEDMSRVHRRYEILCTKEFIDENYKFTDEESTLLAVETRRQMDKYGYDEEEAIEEAIEYLGYEEEMTHDDYE